MTITAKDAFWLWGHEAGSHNSQYGLQGCSRMTPAEAAYYLGIPNMIMVRYHGQPEPPFHQHALALSPLARVVWSIVGAGGTTQTEEVNLILDLAARFPNVCAAIMDDFFNVEREDGSLGTFTPDELAAIGGQLGADERRLDLWVVLYEHQLDLPVSAHLEQCDVVTYWTWWSERLADLEENFERAERLAPTCRRVLGCYMWDYGNGKPMPVDLMEHQCRLGLEWLRQGRIDGMIFLASCICDLGLDAVEWSRQWIQEVGCEAISARG